MTGTVGPAESGSDRSLTPARRAFLKMRQDALTEAGITDDSNSSTPAESSSSCSGPAINRGRRWRGPRCKSGCCNNSIINPNAVENQITKYAAEVFRATPSDDAIPAINSAAIGRAEEEGDGEQQMNHSGGEGAV